MIEGIAGPRPITVMRTAQRSASTTTAPAKRRSAAGERPPTAAEISIMLHVQRTEHCRRAARSSEAASSAPSQRLAVLLRHAETHNATVVEDHLRVPTGLAKNYYYGGRDFDVTHTARVTFASAHDASAFLRWSHDALVRWLHSRSCQAAELRIGAHELPLASERDLELACALLARVTR